MKKPTMIRRTRADHQQYEHQGKGRRRGVGMRHERAEERGEQPEPEPGRQRAAYRSDAADDDHDEGHDDLVEAHAGEDG
jgi:hypothetical protein